MVWTHRCKYTRFWRALFSAAQGVPPKISSYFRWPSRPPSQIGCFSRPPPKIRVCFWFFCGQELLKIAFMAPKITYFRRYKTYFQWFLTAENESRSYSNMRLGAELFWIPNTPKYTTLWHANCRPIYRAMPTLGAVVLFPKEKIFWICQFCLLSISLVGIQ